MILAAALLVARMTCPAEAAGGVDVHVTDDAGKAVADATVLFTAANWDSTIEQQTDSSGNVSVLCVVVGDGHDVTVLKAGYAVTHRTVSTAVEHPEVAIALRRGPSRAVHVTLQGADVPGVTVVIRDSDGTTQALTTDDKGLAPYARLRGTGDAIVEITMPAMKPQRVRVPHAFKNGTIATELTLEPVCKPMIVTSD